MKELQYILKHISSVVCLLPYDAFAIICKVVGLI